MDGWLRSHVGGSSADVYRAVTSGLLNEEALLAAALSPSGTQEPQPGAEQPAVQPSDTPLQPQLERAASSAAPPPPRASAPTVAQPWTTASLGRRRPPRIAAQAASGAWEGLMEQTQQRTGPGGRSLRAASPTAGMPGSAAAAGAPQQVTPQLPPRIPSGLSPDSRVPRKLRMPDLQQGSELPSQDAASEGQRAPAAPSLPPLAGLPPLPPLSSAAQLSLQQLSSKAGWPAQPQIAGRPPVPAGAAPAAGPQSTPSMPGAAEAAAAAPQPANSASTGGHSEQAGDAPEPALQYHEQRLQYKAQRSFAPQV